MRVLQLSKRSEARGDHLEKRPKMTTHRVRNVLDGARRGWTVHARRTPTQGQVAIHRQPHQKSLQLLASPGRMVLRDHHHPFLRRNKVCHRLHRLHHSLLTVHQTQLPRSHRHTIHLLHIRRQRSIAT